ncbi:hydrolase [Pseudoalteromonas phenolica]|uniref:Hydrolase n=1 Tax=Pseudoalteromonas phenolica TaxID=161398 RepID=A0A4Q7IJD9_9GAMM|nr:hydrolase [Pseudoalteromonas phenolica]RZQ51662.1 hydrolase [Pseudoalteromonas phenolica]
MLNRYNTGLVIVDIQGKLASLVHGSEAMISQTVKLVQAAKLLDLPMVFLEQLPEKLGSTIPELQAHLGDIPAIEKSTFDGCGSEEFLQAIDAASVDNWLVCGIEAHICVYQTAISLKEREFGVELVQDCVSSRTLENKELALTKLNQLGISLTSFEMCIYELIKDANDPVFKKVLPLVK